MTYTEKTKRMRTALIALLGTAAAAMVLLSVALYLVHSDREPAETDAFAVLDTLETRAVSTPAESTAPAVSPETTLPPPPVTQPPESSETTAFVSVPAGVYDPGEWETLYPDTVLDETADGGQEYLDSIVFLGDSTTYGLLHYEMLAGGKETAQVWTPVARTLTLSRANYDKILYPDDGEEYLIKDAVGMKKPAVLVITLGVNGVSFMDEDDFASSYGRLIDDIKTASPDTLVILQSIFPVASHYDKQHAINNVKIAAANGWIVKIAADRGVKYLDTYSALIGEDGFLPQDYQNGDGMHLNVAGFNVELDYVRRHQHPDWGMTAPPPAAPIEP
ncbi:MAG: hypothetical protein E7655_08240 [Ruminococcaceae bacterium]|nr:hypothetical protein [Oscillospiraceae bacterium]